MLYLHCGWPRTGTSSLQAVLWGQRQALADAGTIFPRRWLSELSPTHHGLSELLAASEGSEAPLDEFKAFLEAHRHADIIFSAQSITDWLISAKRREALLALVAAAAEVIPIRCIWTLRRVDEAIRSLYLLAMSMGGNWPSPEGQYRVTAYLEPLFTGMRLVGEANGGEVTFVKYDSAGAHQIELVRAFGIAEPAAGVIRDQLKQRPRLNRSLTHKHAVLLANLDVFSARVGVDLDRVALCGAIRSGELAFDEDRRCELVDGEARRRLHEHALGAACEAHFRPYDEFFGDAEITSVEATPSATEVLYERDTEHLIGLCERRKGARGRKAPDS